MSFETPLLQTELVEKLLKSIKDFAPSVGLKPEDFPVCQKTNKKNHDMQYPIQAALKKLKKNPKTDTESFANEFSNFLNDHPNPFIASVSGDNGFIMVDLDSTTLFKATINSVISLGEKFGSCDEMKGKKAIVEHTSANPNGPLHIGNLRNAILGSHLAQLLKTVGYEVEQRFYVNDLGFQIGMTALGYTALKDTQIEKKKSDQWIGLIYAVMNTLQELQESEVDLNQVIAQLKESGKLQSIRETAPEQYQKTILEFTDVMEDLYERVPALCLDLAAHFANQPEKIKDQAGKLNLAYERKEEEAYKLFRGMVNDCLDGMKQTLNIYNIHHNVYDFESELGWTGENDKALSVLTKLPYYVPPTQSNAKGVPEGGHLVLEQFLKESGLFGKKGIENPYPKFYILRPDGSTLYPLRDVVYTLKKGDNADIVLNVIGSEQNLPQQKVMLAVQILRPNEKIKQYHVSYEIVKLVRNQQKVKMSGRRGRYELADDLYTELREKLSEEMKSRYNTRVERAKARGVEMDDYDINEKFVDHVTDELATATMKYTLLGSGQRSQILFDIDKVTNPNEQSAPYVLYNTTRIYSIFKKFDKAVASGICKPLPPIDQIDFSRLGKKGGPEEIEKELVLQCLLPFPVMLREAAIGRLPEFPQLPDFDTNKTVDFLFKVVHMFSKSYYSKVRIITPDDPETMYARLYLCKALQILAENAYRVLTIKPLTKM